MFIWKAKAAYNQHQWEKVNGVKETEILVEVESGMLKNVCKFVNLGSRLLLVIAVPSGQQEE